MVVFSFGLVSILGQEAEQVGVVRAGQYAVAIQVAVSGVKSVTGPSIGVMVADYQAVGFGGFLEFLVVIPVNYSFQSIGRCDILAIRTSIMEYYSKDKNP